MTAQELTAIGVWLNAAQQALSTIPSNAKLEGVRRLIAALRAEVSSLRESALEATVAPGKEEAERASGALLQVGNVLERALDTVRGSRSNRTTTATKLYASLTALRAHVLYLHGLGLDHGPAARAAADLDLPLAPGRPGGVASATQASFRGIPNLARNGWREMRKADHFLQIYDGENGLLRSVAEFIADGLWRGERVIVIATEPHRRSLERRLRNNGVDIVSAIVRRSYVARDADEVLNRILFGGHPDPAAFAEVMTGLVGGPGPERADTRVFAELAACLWVRESRSAALALEKLWGELGSKRGLTLLCGYPADSFTAADEPEALPQLCRLHARVVLPDGHPDEAVMRGTDRPPATTHST